MDINLPKKVPILKSEAFVAEKLECSKEAELEDKMPDAYKNNNKGENECT
jgi:hypothetical protein